MRRPTPVTKWFTERSSIKIKQKQIYEKWAGFYKNWLSYAEQKKQTYKCTLQGEQSSPSSGLHAFDSLTYPKPVL